MDSNHHHSLSTLNEKTINLERWVVPILLMMVVVVGGIRATPWLKSQLSALLDQNTVITGQSAINVANESATNDNTSIQIDTELSPIIVAQTTPLIESRSQQLTESLSHSDEERPRIDISALSDDKILTQDVSPPDANANVTADISALEAITAHRSEPSQEDPAPLTKIEPEEQARASSVTQSATPQNTVSDINTDPKVLIAERINNWAAAWSAKSPEEYFEHYTSDISTKKYPSHEKWRTWRRARLSKPNHIEVAISELEVRLAPNDTKSATARFIQAYKADTYADRVVKSLDLLQTGNRWLIQKETTTQVLPVNE